MALGLGIHIMVTKTDSVLEWIQTPPEMGDVQNYYRSAKCSDGAYWEGRGLEAGGRRVGRVTEARM